MTSAAARTRKSSRSSAWRAARARVPQAAAWDDPKLTFTSRLGRFIDVPPNAFPDQLLSVEQMLPISGKNKCQERIAAAQALQAFEDYRRARLDAVAGAKAAYYRLAGAYALLDLNRDLEAILTHALEVSRAKFEAGTQSQADLLTADVERQRILVARRELERQITEQAGKLQLAMNRDPFAPLGRPVGAEIGVGEPPAERLRVLILTNRPEVRQAEAQRVEALAKLQLARRQWIPDPAFVFQAQRYNEASQAVSELDAGFSVGLPWFNREKYRAGEREAQSAIAAAQAAQEARRTEALALLRDQLQKLDVLRRNAALYRDQLAPTARLAVAARLANYETDKATLLQVLSSEQNWRDLQSAYQQNVADYQAAKAELEALVGVEAVPLDLKRPSGQAGQK